MGKRAKNSGIRLTAADAAIVKGMLARGDRQHDIAAWFGVNSGRVAEVAKGKIFCYVVPVERDKLPPQGPYPSGKEALFAISALQEAEKAIEEAKLKLKDFD